MRGLFLAAAVMAGALGHSAPVAAQTNAKAAGLTVERIWADPALSGPAPRALRFAPDGKSITYLRPKPDNARVLDLWAADLASGEARLLLDGAKLGGDEAGLSEAEKARRERRRISENGVVEYSWAGDGSAILAPVAGDLYLADPKSGQVRQLTNTASDEIAAELSPKGSYASFVRDQNLFLVETASGQEKRVTVDGGGPISFGVAEFIAQEELDRFTGAWWSPTEAQLAYTRVDENPVPLITRADIGADGRTTTVQQRYPATGDANAKVQLFVLDVASGRSSEVALGGEDFYLARVNWSFDGSSLYVQRLSRDQKRLDLLRVNPKTGAAKVILTETDPAWVNLHGNFRTLRNGRFFWTSERSGYNHIYLYDADGRLLMQVTEGAWPVRAIEGVSSTRGLVYFSAGIEDSLQNHLYTAGFTRKTQVRRITAGEGAWGATFNSDASAFIGTYSDPKTPPQTALYDERGQRIRWIEENAVDADHPWSGYAARYPAPEFGAITAKDGATLYTRVLKPVGFDPAKRYPAILFVYGGPHRQVVEKSWGSVSAVMRLMQERGYVVFSIDNRGTPDRGRDFERAIAGELGKLEVQDQLEGVGWLKRQSFVDGARVGVWGWSYGGFMALALPLRAPDVFAAAASFAPVTDWRLYDTAYTERYMGQPKANASGYAAADLTRLAANMRTPLLLAHGLADDNVVFANSAAMMNALQTAGVQFETLVYPGQKHGISGRTQRLHWTNALMDFFDRNLQQPR